MKTGEFRQVERDNAYALVGLDNRHNGDYKVSYASDPVLVVHSKAGVSHKQLRETLKKNGLWLEEFQPIDIPCNEGYKAGFKSLPRSANRLNLVESRIEKIVEREMDLMTGENGLTAFLPS